MHCPNCQHVYTDKQVKCASCGRVYDRSALEGLENLEYLTGWLDEHQDELAAPGYRRLRQVVEQQLAERRGLLVHGAAPAPQPVAPSLPAAPARPAEQVVRELVLLTDFGGALDSIVKASAIKPVTATNLRRVLADERQQLKAELAGRTAEAPQVSPLAVIEYAQHRLGDWNNAAHMDMTDRLNLLSYLRAQHDALLWAKAAPAAPAPAQTAALPAVPTITTPAPAPQPAPARPVRVAPQPVLAPRPVAAPKVVAAPPRPAPPPRPARPPRPPINWAKVWERGWQLVVSGALLRGLLYLGALMIVASAVVLVVRFWNNFPTLLQLGFVAAVPVSFYAGGFVLRSLKIPVAGSVFTGIGALLVAVDLAAVYQLGGLSRVVALPLYWFGSSIFCAALYLFTLYRARGEFFGYLTLIGGANVAVAAAVALGLRPECG